MPIIPIIPSINVLALRRTVFALLFFSLLPVPLFLYANDATFGGEGADLVLLSENRIRMASEEIRLVENWEGESNWRVYAHYLFENPTGERVSVRMGFPEMAHCQAGGSEEEADTYDPHFRNLQTFVRGTPVELSTGSVKKSGGDFCLGRVYIFEVTFEPYEHLEIDHHYEYTGTLSSTGVSVDYLTLTGSLWSGSIGRADFTVVLAGLPSRIYWPKEYHLIEQYRDRFPTDPYGTVRTVYHFRQENWVPQGNFNVEVEARLWDDESFPECCPEFESFKEILQGNDPEGALRAMAECLPADSIRICRNIIYARYGRPFSDTILSRRFYSDPTLLTSGGYREEDGILTVGYQVNPRYSDDLLTREEREIALLLHKIEEERSED